MISYKNGKLVVKGEKVDLFKDACEIVLGLSKIMDKDPGELGKDIVNYVLAADSVDMYYVKDKK